LRYHARYHILRPIMATKEVAAKKAVPTASSVKIPELVEMLEAGVHFGHERSKKNPKMDEYIFMLRNRMAIIDLEKTQIHLQRAVEFLFALAQDENKDILFVGTKRQTREITKRYATAAGMPYVTQRWVGGMLTNFSTLLKSIEKLEEFKKIAADEAALGKMIKKERVVHLKEIERLEKVLEGTRGLKKLPAAIIVIGSHDEKLAVREANRVGIPVVGITDTNADPDLVEYPIPANDDAIRAIDLVVGTLARAILAARGRKLEDSLPPSEAADTTPAAVEKE
jgi:small subunit ribosomal protein S2